MAEIESAIEKLPLKEKLRLLDSLGQRIVREQAVLPAVAGSKVHSILDIPVASVGGVLKPGFSRSELFDEMLEERA